MAHNKLKSTTKSVMKMIPQNYVVGQIKSILNTSACASMQYQIYYFIMVILVCAKCMSSWFRKAHIKSAQTMDHNKKKILLDKF